ncbi:MAG: transglycosylase domain-containing protein [Hyphomonadaceae bacterium]|nr:transglycosylase domain-containing protein [Hyphomonadaceae bacterium]
MTDFNSRLAWARQQALAAQARIAGAMKLRTRFTVAGAAVAGLIAAAAASAAVWGWVFIGLPHVPDAQTLWSMNRQPSVTFLDRNGAVIGVRGPFYGSRARLEDLPAHVPQAFLAIEDRRFYEHEGVDRMAIIRAAFANMSAGRTVQGGSTISQQLVKNLFLTPDRTVRRKVQEMVLAARIERMLSKDDILDLYLNRVYLGDQAYGVDAAAQRYFGKRASDLTLAEAAMLAGLPKAPSRSAPTESLERATERQRLVLDAMVDAGFITREAAIAAAAEEIAVSPRRRSNENALGYVFDLAFAQACEIVGEDERRPRAAADVDSLTCPARNGRDAGRAPLVPDLVIHTTIDTGLQNEATQAVRERLGAAGRADPPLQAAAVFFDREGAVRALVGGVDYTQSKFNRVTQARRQPGSAFKTFVYAAALADGVGTEEVRYDEPVVIDNWRPRNYDAQFHGAVTLRTAFADSLNTVAARLGEEVGFRTIANLAETFGISSMPGGGEFVPPSITLGSIETTPWEMARAFGVFMREGRSVDPFLVARLENTRGDRIYQRPPTPDRLIYATELAHDMTSLMGAVVLRGTGTRAQIDGRDVAGKTGTSQDWRDAWFIGYSADFTGAVWVGYDDYGSMAQRGRIGRQTGGALPAEIWRDVMVDAHRGIEPHRLPGIEQPRPTPRQVELAGFYGMLKEALGADFPLDALPPPDDFFR